MKWALQTRTNLQHERRKGVPKVAHTKANSDRRIPGDQKGGKNPPTHE